MTLYWDLVDSPCGPLLCVADPAGAVVRIEFAKGRSERTMRLEAEAEAGLEEAPEGLAEVRCQLAEYFAGERTTFELELRPVGTPFQLAVWRALRQIPFGRTTSYGDLAQQLGTPGGSRAVGAANGANPIPIVVPCHRVIGADGSLTGFGGGLPAKRLLLELEGARPGTGPRQLELGLNGSRES